MTQCWKTNNSEFSFQKLFPDTTNYRLGWAKSSRIEEMCLKHIFPVINFITFVFFLSPVPRNDKVFIRYRHSIWGAQSSEQWKRRIQENEFLKLSLSLCWTLFLPLCWIHKFSIRRARAWTKIKVQVLFIFLLLLFLGSLQLPCALLAAECSLRREGKEERWSDEIYATCLHFSLVNTENWVFSIH